MAELLHEYWETEDGGTFGVVSASDDQFIAATPGARFIFDLWASCWEEAMQGRNDRLGYGRYEPIEGVTDHVYTQDEAEVQRRYLAARVRPGDAK